MTDLKDISLQNGKILILAYDQGLEVGPSCLDEWSGNSDNIFSLAMRNGFSGIALQKGLAEQYYLKKSETSAKIPSLIVKVNGKTSLYTKNSLSLLNCSLDYAKKIGAKAIGYTIYVGSEHESEMMSEASKIQEFCRETRTPFVLWSYPKLESLGPKDKSSELSATTIAYTARVGYELGADVVKLKFPHFEKELSREDKITILSEIVAIANSTKVLFQGQKLMDEEDFFDNVNLVRESGADGMAIGRNIWGSEHPDLVSEKLLEIWSN